MSVCISKKQDTFLYNLNTLITSKKNNHISLVSSNILHIQKFQIVNKTLFVAFFLKYNPIKFYTLHLVMFL